MKSWAQSIGALCSTILCALCLGASPIKAAETIETGMIGAPNSVGAGSGVAVCSWRRATRYMLYLCARKEHLEVEVEPLPSKSLHTHGGRLPRLPSMRPRR
jgi:hypothetical protein